ncbi:MAG: hypothetical protein ACO1RX_15800 [Candidatus Sericytochromatia bacterium]
MGACSGWVTIFKPTVPLPVLEADPLNIGVIWSSAQPGGAQANLLRAFYSHVADQHPECRLYSLETQSPAPAGVTELAAGLASETELRSWLQKLDLVISPGHPFAELAQELQRPLWLLASESVPDKTPYADFHCFATPTPGEWSSVFAQIETALAQIYGR